MKPDRSCQSGLPFSIIANFQARRHFLMRFSAAMAARAVGHDVDVEWHGASRVCAAPLRKGFVLRRARDDPDSKWARSIFANDPKRSSE
jgi:hypothetical protein